MKPVTEPILRAAANAFDFGGPVVCDARHYGEGHINDTFVVWREDHSKRFILQRINTDTFTDPVGLMENICGVTRHLREKILAAGGDPARETLNVIPTLSGAAFHLDAEGGAWRAYDFVEDTICLQQVGSEADFRTVAETLGKFQNQLADYPASTLHETIARFHDTPNRYANFEKALAADALGRAKDIAPEVAFIHAREKDCHVLLDLLAAGEIPLRVTHNDTKINNVLIDAATGKGICVIERQTNYLLYNRFVCHPTTTLNEKQMHSLPPAFHDSYTQPHIEQDILYDTPQTSKSGTEHATDSMKVPETHAKTVSGHHQKYPLHDRKYKA